MSFSIRAWVALGVFAGAAASLLAQAPLDDPPKPARPLTPQTRAELDRREALKLYALGLSLERDNLLLEAARTYERALDLDPDSTAIRKALAPLYLALDRGDDALDVCREVVERDPGDYDTWYLLARQYRVLGKNRDAADALKRAAGCEGLAEHPELRLQIATDLAEVYEGGQDFAAAESALANLAEILDNPEPLVEMGVFSREEAAAQAAESYERLGRAAVKAGHADKAVAAYRKAQQKDPDRALRLDYNLADVYASQGQLNQALASLDAYLRSLPQGTEAYEMKIDLLRKLGRPGDVVPSLRSHSLADSENVELKLMLARECGKAGQGNEAEGIYKTLLKKTARVDVYRGLFTLYKGQGDGGGKMLTMLDQALKSANPDPMNGGAGADASVEAARARSMLLVLREDPAMVKLLLPAAKQQLVQRWQQDGLHPETRRFLAVLASRTGLLADAEQLYRSCLQDNFFGRRGEHALYQGLLTVLWQERKYEDVVKVCRDGLAAAQATNRVLFHVNLARALVLLDRNDEAIEEANKAVDFSGDDERAYSRGTRVRVLASAGKLDEAAADALAWLKEAKEADEVVECRYTLSQVYSQAKNYPKAEEQLRLIIQEHPDEATAHNDLGYTWADQGKNLDEAERLIRRALELDKKNRTTGTHADADSDRDNAAYVDSLGWVLFRRGKLDEAKAELEKAVKLPDGEDDPTVWDHLGDVYYRLNESQKAKAAWEKAVELSATGRRKADDRLRDLRGKIKLLEQAGPRR